MLLAAAIAAGCSDGGHFFRGVLEPGPVIPAAPQAETTPVAAFDAADAPFAAATYGASGPQGIALVRADTITGVDDPGSQESQIEESDALVCDPANDRIVLAKARVRDTAKTLSFATLASGASPTAVVVTTDRHALVATATGYSIIDKLGTEVHAAALAGGPFQAIVLNEEASILFIAGAGGIERIQVDSGFAPTSTAVAIHAGGGVRGLALRANGDLLFTEGNQLFRIASASTAVPGSALPVFTFGGADEPRGVVVNSIGNAVVAVAGPTNELVEIVVDSGSVATDGMLVLGGEPRGLAIDGRHSAFAWTSATGVVVQVETTPDLTKRILPIFSDRACLACHFSGSTFTTTPLDLSSAFGAVSTMVGVARDCAGGSGSTVRVVAGSSGTSFLIDKVRGVRDGSDLASCGERMPLDAASLEPARPIPQVEIDMISRWIDGGASQ
jgi:hypothetical protein